MNALKCLQAGGIAPFSRLAWPLPSERHPGAWVEAEPHVCASGIHACLDRDLPYWLADELWTIELEDVHRAERKLVARRGRLLARVTAWNEEAMRDFALDCAARAEAIAGRDPALAGYVGDARSAARAGKAPATGFIVARLAELVNGAGAYEDERVAQSDWIADRLRLDGRPG